MSARREIAQLVRAGDHAPYIKRSFTGLVAAAILQQPREKREPLIKAILAGDRDGTLKILFGMNPENLPVSVGIADALPQIADYIAGWQPGAEDEYHLNDVLEKLVPGQRAQLASLARKGDEDGLLRAIKRHDERLKFAEVEPLRAAAVRSTKLHSEAGNLVRRAGDLLRLAYPDAKPSVGLRHLKGMVGMYGRGLLGKDKLTFWEHVVMDTVQGQGEDFARMWSGLDRTAWRQLRARITKKLEKA